MHLVTNKVLTVIFNLKMAIKHCLFKFIALIFLTKSISNNLLIHSL